MKNVTQELARIVKEFETRINAIGEEAFSAKPNPAKWSKKEVLGHLIDSGNNNLRRFICGQYESIPPQIAYDQDFWVQANRYQQATKQEVVSLWALVNRQIGRVLDQMPSSNYSRMCDTGNENPNLHSLEWLAEDYVKHLKHHLNQIIPGSFDIVYR